MSSVLLPLPEGPSKTTNSAARDLQRHVTQGHHLDLAVR